MHVTYLSEIYHLSKLQTGYLEPRWSLGAARGKGGHAWAKEAPQSCILLRVDELVRGAGDSLCMEKKDFSGDVKLGGGRLILL